MIVLLCLLSTSPSPSPSPSLELAFKREASLLAAEKSALAAELERISVDTSGRTAALRKEIAGLEAELVDQSARTETLRGQLAAAVGRNAAADDDVDVDVQSVILETFAALHLPAPTSTDGTALLASALDGLARRQTPQSLATGFFDHDGTFVDGVVVSWGGLGWGASGDRRAAGPLLPADEGARQVGVDDDRARALSLAFVDRPAAPAPGDLLPLLLRASTTAGGPADAVATTTKLQRLQRLGTGGPMLLLALLASLVFALVSLVHLRRERGSVDVVVGRLAGLVGSNEQSAAAALARTVRGGSGVFLRAVVDACVRPDADEQVAALAAAAFAAHDARVRRVLMGGAAAAAVVVVVACTTLGVAFDALAGTADVRPRAVLDALSVGLLPLELLALWSIPFLAALMLLSGAVAAAKERLEQQALRLIDARERST
ncbi:MAG: hypothetical protein Q8O67_29395 [Deltaproteobacteria bacterium]|nr:hypothetical protein [Deltaproteobacteria bacterium]